VFRYELIPADHLKRDDILERVIRAFLPLSVLAACSFTAGSAGIVADAVSDGATDSDGSADAPCAWNSAPSNFDPSAAEFPMPTPRLSLGGGPWVYNTDNGTLTSPNGSSTVPAPASLTIAQPGGPTARILVVAQFGVPAGGGLLVTGSMPLIVAANTIEIDGLVNDLAVGSASGPGANLSCQPPPGMSSPTIGGGGGGGGGFGTAGAAGAAGDDGGGSGGSAGSATGNADLTPIVGGCPGAPGGSSAAASGGAGGGGGGALQLSACESVTINGTIDLAGGGGQTGDLRSGGGGGGAGGGLLVESSTIAVEASAKLCANGGAGGNGGALTGSSNNGGDGTCSATTGATTVVSSSGAGNGGGGAFSTNAAIAGSSGTGERGGGAGGGGVGRIHFHGTATVAAGAVVTPPQQ
jgi:hypothetical protein